MIATVLVADDAADTAAGIVEDVARDAIRSRGNFVVALSGGSTPEPLFRRLATGDVDWNRTHVAQVDERIVHEDSDERNLTMLRATLPRAVAIEAMPVETDDDGSDYARRLAAIAGDPPLLDLVHLGLGEDGHTASLVPGDAVLGVEDRDVAVTAPYAGRPRMTLTYPLIDRARMVLWFVTGEDKARIVRRLVAGDTSFPAGRVAAANQVMVLDRAAATELGST